MRIMQSRAALPEVRASRRYLLLCLILLGCCSCVLASLPAGWANADLGSPGVAGSSSAASGVYAISGVGANHMGMTRAGSDQCQYCYRGYAGYGQIVAWLSGQPAPGVPGTECGLMIRGDLTANGIRALFSIRRYKADLAFSVRTSAGVAPNIQLVGGAAFPIWVKLARVGKEVFVVFTSMDGTNWTQVGNACQLVGMPDTAYYGLWVSSGDNATRKTAVFDHVSVSAATMPAYRTSWLGNSFGAYKWVQKDALNLAVAADGRCYVPATWDEAGHSCGIYQNGDVWGGIKVNEQAYATGAVAVDDTYVFCGSWSADQKQSGLARYHLDGSPAPDVNGAVFFPISTQWLGAAALKNGLLYVADPAAGAIRVFDRVTMQQQRSFPCAGCSSIAVEHGGNVWALRGVSPLEARQYTPAGLPTGKVITGIAGAAAIALNSTNKLLVAGPRNQVWVYDTATVPAVVATIGTLDGIYGGTRGQMQSGRLANLAGVGVDSHDNVYVVSRYPSGSYGIDLRKFSPTGVFQWQVYCNQFGDIPAIDPASDSAEVYTNDEHFHLDYTRQGGQEARWVGYTLDPSLDDLRNNACNRLNTNGNGAQNVAPFMARMNGHRLYSYAVSSSGYIAVYRQNAASGECWVPSALLNIDAGWHLSFNHWPPTQAAGTRWFWRDLNGDGRIEANEYAATTHPIEFINQVYVDSNGGIWMAGSTGGGGVGRCIYHLAVRGFDAYQNPIYDVNDLATPAAIPAEFTEVYRLQYDELHDAMYLSGVTATHPTANAPLGSEMIRYDNWSTPQRHLHARILLPQNPTEDYNYFGFYQAGKYLFMAHRLPQYVTVYDADTLQVLTTLYPGPEIGNFMGGVDLPYCIRAYQRTTGEYEVFVEDDNRAKIVLYRWTLTGIASNGPPTAVSGRVNNPPSCRLTAPANNATYTVNSTVTLAATASAIDGAISKVEFYAQASSGNNLKVGEAASLPYSVNWFVPLGTDYTVTAKAIDNHGHATISGSVLVHITGTPCPIYGAPPAGTIICEDGCIAPYVQAWSNDTREVFAVPGSVPLSGEECLALWDTGAHFCEYNVPAANPVGPTDVIRGWAYVPATTTPQCFALAFYSDWGTVNQYIAVWGSLAQAQQTLGAGAKKHYVQVSTTPPPTGTWTQLTVHAPDWGLKTSVGMVRAAFCYRGDNGDNFDPKKAIYLDGWRVEAQ